jgi:hypothetical protein
VKRTPKNYQGVGSTIKDIRSLLPDILKKMECKSKNNPQEIIDEWGKLIGKRLASFTQGVYFDEGVLYVRVQSSTLLSLFAHQEKGKLLKLLQKKFSNEIIKDIQFRIG